MPVGETVGRIDHEEAIGNHTLSSCGNNDPDARSMIKQLYVVNNVTTPSPALDTAQRVVHTSQK